MPKLFVVVLTMSPSRFYPTSQARFLIVPLRHAIVRTKTSTTVKIKCAYHQASTSIQVLQCKLHVNLEM
jgi:hypothetical protein